MKLLFLLLCTVSLARGMERDSPYKDMEQRLLLHHIRSLQNEIEPLLPYKHSGPLRVRFEALNAIYLQASYGGDDIIRARLALKKYFRKFGGKSTSPVHAVNRTLFSATPERSISAPEASELDKEFTALTLSQEKA